MFSSEYYDDTLRKYLEVLLRQAGVPEEEIEQVTELVQQKPQHRVFALGDD